MDLFSFVLVVIRGNLRSLSGRVCVLKGTVDLEREEGEECEENMEVFDDSSSSPSGTLRNYPLTCKVLYSYKVETSTHTHSYPLQLHIYTPTHIKCLQLPRNHNTQPHGSMYTNETNCFAFSQSVYLTLTTMHFLAFYLYYTT